MGTKTFGEFIKEQYPGWDKYLSTETEDAYVLDLSGCEVRHVTAGEVLLHFSLTTFTNEKDCWMLVKNCGQNPDGRPLFMAMTDRRHVSREEGLDEWAWLRHRVEG